MTTALTSLEDAAAVGRLDVIAHALASASGPAQKRFAAALAQRAVDVAEPSELSELVVCAFESAGVRLPKHVALEAPSQSLVVPFVHREIGFARRMLASFDMHVAARGIWLSEEALHAVEHAFRAAAKKATPAHPLARYRFTPWLSDGLAHVHVDGASLGAAAFVSAFSLWSGRAVVPGTAMSAALVGDAVRGVDGVAKKIEALCARADIRRIVVARENAEIARAALSEKSQIELLFAGNLNDLISLSVAEYASPPRALDERMDELKSLFDRGWDAYRWPFIRERIEQLASETHRRPDLDVEVWTMLGAAERHLGNVRASAHALKKAEGIAAHATDDIPDATRARLFDHLALTQLALGDFRDAARHARLALRATERGHLRLAQIKAHSCIGLVELARGHAEKAVTAQRASLELAHRFRPDNCARSHAYLMDALGKTNNRRALDAAFREAMKHLAVLPKREQELREPWLRVSYGGGLVEMGAFAAALKALDIPLVRERVDRDIVPGLFARRHIGRALAAQKATREDGWRLLSESLFAYEFGHNSRFHVSAAINIVFECVLRAHAISLTDDARKRLTAALELLEHDELYGAFFSPFVEKIRAELPGASWIARAEKMLKKATERGL